MGGSVSDINGNMVPVPGNVTDDLGGTPDSTGRISDQKYTIVSNGSFTIHIAISGNVSVAPGPRQTTGGLGYCTVGAELGPITVSTYPITISAPDPLGRPDLGDGKNQYVYGAQQPDGYLYVPGAARAVGASAPAMQWLLANGPVDMAIDNSVIPNTFTHLWTVSGDTLFINTPNNSYSNYQANSWVFKGLPSQNSGFGNHDVNLYVQNTKTQTAKIQTFFSGTASNWPDAGAALPNWYYYYNQVYRATGAYDSSATSSYTDPYSPPNYYIHIGNDAYHPDSFRVFDISPVSNYVRWVGSLDVSGISRYITVCAHEAGHQSMFVSGGIYYFSPDPSQSDVSYVSADGDNVRDTWEINHHLDPTIPDTANAYGVQSSGDKGDNEVLADVQALPVVFQQANTWKQDWADGGVQWGTNTYTTGTPAGFYFVFHAAVAGKTMTPGNVYSIRSLSELQQQYPTLLVGLP